MPTYLKFNKYITFALCVLLGFITNPLLSQDQAKIDSLRLLLKTSRDTSRFTLLTALFQATNQTNFEEALGYANAAYSYAESSSDSVLMVKAGRMIAYSLDDLGRNEEALLILNKVIRIAQRNQERHPELKVVLRYLYNNAGIAYMYIGKYDSSLSYHFKSLEIREAEGDQRSIGTAQNNIGLVYFKLKNHEKALEYYLNSLSIKRELNDQSDIDLVLNNVGLCYVSLRNSAKAIESFNEALGKCKPNCSPAVIIQANFGLGRAYNSTGDFERASSFFKISLEHAEKQNDTRYVIENLNNLGSNERSLNNLKKSVEYSLEANDLAQRFRYIELQIDIFKELSTTYNLIHDFENAALFQNRYIKLKDSIYSGDLIKNLASIQTNFEQRENLKTIKLINENIKLKDEQLQRQRLQYLFIVLVTILIVLLATVLIWANRKQHRHNAALSEANRVIEEQNKELTKTNEELDHRVQEKTRDLFLTNESLTEVNEELDNFIYRTSHDIRGPLVTLKGVCNVAMLDVKDDLALDYMRRLDVTAGKLNSILTRLLFVNQINHAELVAVEVNFKTIIEGVINKERSQPLPSNFSIEYDVSPSVKLISDRELVEVILENLIENAIKFYNTSDRISPFVKIRIRKSGPKQISIQVEDNGIGVSSVDRDQIFHLFVRASERSETGGIGLYLSKLSTQRLGGEIVLRDSSERGSTFLVFLPSDLTPILEKRRELEELRKKDKALREREAQLARQKAEEPSEAKSNSENKRA